MTTAGWITVLIVLLVTVAVTAAGSWAQRVAPTSRPGELPGLADWSGRVAQALALPLPGPHGTRVLLVVALVLGILVTLTAPGVVMAAVAAGAVVFVRRRHGGRPDLDGALVDAVEELIAQLDSGTGLLPALGRLDPTGPAAVVGLTAVPRSVAEGRSLVVSLDAWAASCGATHAHLVADGVALAGQTGAGQAATLGRVVARLRERQALSGEARAQAAPAQASAAVVGGLPLVVAGAALAVDPGVRRVLLRSPLGLSLLLGGLVAELVGVLWMRRLVEGVA